MTELPARRSQLDVMEDILEGVDSLNSGSTDGQGLSVKLANYANGLKLPVAVDSASFPGLTNTQLRATAVSVRLYAQGILCYGANKPTLASLGTLLSTIPTDVKGGDIYIQNQSGGSLYLVLDDGTVTPPTTYEVDILTGVGAGLQGDSRHIVGFTGRVLIYGASGSQVAAWRR